MISHPKNRVQAIKSKFENLNADPPLKSQLYKIKNDSEKKANKENSFENRSLLYESDVSSDECATNVPNPSYLYKNEVKRSVSDSKAPLTRQTSDPTKKLHRSHAFRCERTLLSPKRHGSSRSANMESKLSSDRLKKLGDFLEEHMKKENFVPTEMFHEVRETSPAISIPDDQVPPHILAQYAKVIKPRHDKTDAMTDSGVSSETENLDDEKSRVKRLTTQFELDKTEKLEKTAVEKPLLTKNLGVTESNDTAEPVQSNLHLMEDLACSTETMRLERKNPHLILTDTLKKALKQPLPPGPPPKKPPRTFNNDTEKEKPPRTFNNNTEKEKSDTKRKLEKLEQLLLKREAEKKEKNIYDIAEENVSLKRPKDIHYLCTDILDITQRTLLPNTTEQNQNQNPLKNCFGKLNCTLANSMSSLPYSRFSNIIDSNRNSCSYSHDNLLNGKSHSNDKSQANGFISHLKPDNGNSAFYVDNHIYDEPYVANENKYGTLNCVKINGGSKSMEDLRVKENKETPIYETPYLRSSTPDTEHTSQKTDFQKLLENFERGSLKEVKTLKHSKIPNFENAKLINFESDPKFFIDDKPEITQKRSERDAKSLSPYENNQSSEKDTSMDSKVPLNSEVNTLKVLRHSGGETKVPTFESSTLKSEIKAKKDSKIPFEGFERSLDPSEVKEIRLASFEMNERLLAPSEVNKRLLAPFEMNERLLTPSEVRERHNPSEVRERHAPSEVNERLLVPSEVTSLKEARSVENLDRKYVKRSDLKFATEGRKRIGQKSIAQLDVDRENLNRLMDEIYETVTAACNMSEHKPGSFPTDQSDGSTSEESVKLTRSLTEKRKNYVRRVSSRLAYLDPKSIKNTRFRHQTSICSYKSEIIDNNNPYSTFRSWKSFRASQNNLAVKMDCQNDSSLTDSLNDSDSLDGKAGCVDFLPERENSVFNVCLLVGLNYMTGQAYVKSVFPSQVKVPQHIENLIFPETFSQEKDDWTTDADSTQCYSFVLTDERGERSYGYCRRVLPEGATTCLPLCYCLISKYRAPGFYYKVLKEIESHHGSTEIESNIVLQKLFESDFPNPGESITISYKTDSSHVTNPLCDESKCRTMPELRSLEDLDENFDNNNGFKVKTISRPIETRVEDTSMCRLLDTCGAGVVVKMFATLLLERKLIIRADTLSTLSSCMEGVQNCLYPFVWQQPLISCAPAALHKEVALAPLPLLSGVLQPATAPTLAVEEGMLIDLTHTSKILFYQGDETTILPTNSYKTLKTSLQMEAVKNNKDKDCKARNVMISVTFLRFFVEILGDFWKYFSVGERKEFDLGKGDVIFDKENFIKNATSKQNQYFLEWFTETAMFNHFIQNMSVIYYYKFVSDVENDTYKLIDTPYPNFYQLFEERVQARLSRNNVDRSGYKNALNKKVKLLKTRLKELVG